MEEKINALCQRIYAAAEREMQAFVKATRNGENKEKISARRGNQPAPESDAGAHAFRSVPRSGTIRESSSDFIPCLAPRLEIGRN